MIKPLPDHVLIKHDTPDDMSKGGVILDTKLKTYDNKAVEATVIAIADNITDVKVDDKIIIHRLVGEEYKEFHVVEVGDIVGVWE
jgi:co-chaperonin GroES (HSP10)